FIKVSELTDERHAHCLLAFYELAVEEIYQRVPFSRIERVLPELRDGAASLILLRRRRLVRALIGWLRHYTCPPLKLGLGTRNGQRDRDDDKEAAHKTAFH